MLHTRRHRLPTFKQAWCSLSVLQPVREKAGLSGGTPACVRLRVSTDAEARTGACLRRACPQHPAAV